MYYSSKNFASPLHTSLFPQLLYNSPNTVFFDLCYKRQIRLDCLLQLESSYSLLHEKFLAQSSTMSTCKASRFFMIAYLSSLPYSRSVNLFYYTIALNDCALRGIKKTAFLRNKERYGVFFFFSLDTILNVQFQVANELDRS